MNRVAQPHQPPAACAHELFERQVALAPDAPAVEHRTERLTYGELNARANRLARALRAAGVRTGDRVGLRAVRSAQLVVALLAVLKAGAGYVPLESGFPPASLARIVTETGVRLVVTCGAAWDGPPLPVFDPAAEAAAIAELPGGNLDVAVSPDDTLYVPFTSGSTGVPKGTDVPHRALPGFFRDTYAGWGPGLTGLLHSSLSWDGHLLDLFPSLLTGGRVVVAPAELRDPVEIATLARDSAVTTLWLSAQAFNTVVDVDPALLSGLRWLVVGGETLSVAHVRRAATALPALRLVNGYGPSECTVFTCVRPITAADLAGPIPIGRPVGDREAHVLDDTGDPVPDGVTGELYVAGPAVPHGYLGRPALTAERFVPDPFSGRPGARLYRTGDLVSRRADGALEFHGRGDGQVKLRGFRVELSEVEAVLRAHPGVADAAAAVDRSGPAERLVAYVVPAHGDRVPDGLAEHAAAGLHAAMTPAGYLALPRLPLSRTGKLDRSALPPFAPGRDQPAGTPPRGEAEERAAAVWREVLGAPAIGRDANFFLLGGDSLLATRVVARLRGWAGPALTIRDLYEAPVLADFAAAADAMRAAGGGPAAPPPIRRAARVRATAPRPARTP
jgi:amino acid adenylation domain-containing protein